MSTQDCDVVVVGGGMIGAAFAAALADSPLSVALLDAGGRPSPPPTDRYDLRVSAISPGSSAILESSGAWEHIRHKRVEPYQCMHVWDAFSNGSIEFDAAALGEPCLGFIVENANVQDGLMTVLDAAPNIDCRFDAAVERIDFEEGYCRVALEHGGDLSASLVVGADGAGSRVRDALGIGVNTRLYGQRAFVCEVRTALAHRHTAWQRFLSTGPVAFLPLANGHCSVVWTCDAELAEELAGVDDAVFQERLGDAFDRRLGDVTIVSPVRSFELSRRRAERYVVERGALIGDAAHVVHPLAGQGANLGFGDAWSLAQVLLEAQRSGRDIGRQHVLRRYERWRRSENFFMMQMLDALHGMFSSQLAVARGARGLGLKLVDRQQWLKRFFAHQATRAGDATAS